MNAIHHVSLSVLDLSRSAAWYRQVFRLTPGHPRRGREPGRFGLPLRRFAAHARTGPPQGQQHEPFTPRNTGLDHVAVDVESREDLERWVQWLNELAIDNSGLIDLPIGSIVNFTDPDGIQLALFWERAVDGE